MDIPTIYCEQLGFSIQYLNIATNLLFVLFAFLVIRTIKKKYKIVEKRDYILASLLVLIGVGSFFWHAMPARWSDYADTIPIVIFALTALILISNKIFNTRISQILFLTLSLLIGFFLERLPILNGTLSYIFLCLLLILSASFFSKKNKEMTTHFFIASVFFIAGIFARSFDLVLCDLIPLGTHFLWHTLIAVMGYYLILGISRLYKN